MQYPKLTLSVILVGLLVFLGMMCEETIRHLREHYRYDVMQQPNGDLTVFDREKQVVFKVDLQRDGRGFRCVAIPLPLAPDVVASNTQ